MLDDEVPTEAKEPPETPEDQARAGLLEGQAGCIVMGVPIAVAWAAYAIFEEGVRNNAAWPAATAIWALAIMGVGVIAVTMRGLKG